MKTISRAAPWFALCAALAITQPASAQGLLGNLLNGMAHKSQQSRQSGFSDIGIETYLAEFTLRNGTMTLSAMLPLENLSNVRLASCIATTSSSKQLEMSKYLLRDPLKPKIISQHALNKNNEYYAQDGDSVKLYATMCGPVSIAPGTLVDATNKMQFISMGLDPDSLVEDATAAMAADERRTAAADAQKAQNAANQARLDKLWDHTSVTYLANGEFAQMSTDEFSPFDTADECRTAVTKMIKATIANSNGGLVPVGESVLAASDGSGWFWVACVNVKDLNSGAVTNYANVKMTPEKARSMKLVVDFLK